MNWRWPIWIFLAIIVGTSSGGAVYLSCPSCVLGNCQCSTDCSSGNIDIFDGNSCSGTPYIGLSFGGNTITWGPEEEKTYRAKIFCDDGGVSACESIVVGGSSESTTSSTSTTTTSSITSTTTAETTTTLAGEVSISCYPCQVGVCQCLVGCSSGSLDVFGGGTCGGSPESIFIFSGNIVSWNPGVAGIYRVKVFCDDDRSSNCENIVVSTSTTFTIIWPPRPRTTTTKLTTTTTTTIKSTTTIEVTSTTTTTTTTSTRATTTTISVCNRNGQCETATRGETHMNCPQDCPSGSPDGYCDEISEGICDPDCLSWEDSDCQKSQCGNNVCESVGGENYNNCPQDCQPSLVCGDGTCNWLEGENYIVCPEDCQSGKKDGYCDGLGDEKCDPDCQPGEDGDCGGDLLSWLIGALPYLIAFLLLLVIVFLIIKRGKKEENSNDRVKEWIRKKLKEGEDPEVLRKGLNEEGFDPGLVDQAEEKLWS